MVLVAPQEEESTLSKYLQEHEGTLTPECMSLLGTVPFEKFWYFPYLFQHRGFCCSPHLFNGILSIQKNFKANHSDVLLATIPKAGTTWLKALLFTLLNRSRHSPNSSNDVHPLLRSNPHDLVPFLEANLYRNDQDPDLSGFVAPRLFSTHIPFSLLPSSIKSSECKIIYLCRNPKDAFVSGWHFLNKLIPDENGRAPLKEAFDKFCRGVTGYGPYWDHALEYWKAREERPNKVLFLKYEEIKEPYKQLRQLADFLGCPFNHDQEVEVEEILRLCSFNNLSRLEVNRSEKNSFDVDKDSFFRRGEVGDSANYLTQEMIQRLDRITEEKLHGSNLKL